MSFFEWAGSISHIATRVVNMSDYMSFISLLMSKRQIARTFQSSLNWSKIEKIKEIDKSKEVYRVDWSKWYKESAGMETGSTKAISEVKQEIRLREWSEQIERQQSSGLSVEQWCVKNGIKPKTYYYRLRRVREQCVATQPSIVPIAMPDECGNIRIEKNGMSITLPCGVAPETLIALVRELCWMIWRQECRCIS